jgi:hypothetical protein
MFLAFCTMQTGGENSNNRFEFERAKAKFTVRLTLIGQSAPVSLYRLVCTG